MRSAIRMSLSLSLLASAMYSHALPSRLESVDADTNSGSQRWQLVVAGEPYQIRGVGCAQASGANGTDYLQLAQQLGANTVRTWGLTHTDRNYLDRAAELGLQVAVGIWLPYPKSQAIYRNPDAPELQKLRSEILARVEALRSHPAVMLWVAGNEVLHMIDEPAERSGFLRFLEDLVLEIKRRDPDHLVTYAATGSVDLQALKQSVPSLDLIGINLYGDPRKMQQRKLEANEIRPLLFTEFGPRRPEDMGADNLGHARVPTDAEKTQRYQRRLNQLQSLDQQTLGAFVFRLGDPKPDDLHWWNLSLGEYPRAAYAAVARHYGGADPGKIPTCKAQPINRSQVTSGESLQLKVSELSQSGAKYGVRFWPINPADRHQPASVLLSPEHVFTAPNVQVSAPQQPGDYWLITQVINHHGNACMQRISLRVTL